MSAPAVVDTAFWTRLEDGRVQCDVCPHFCRLREGQRGLCAVRANEGGRIVLTTYGRSSGFCVDPIEKKPLNHFLPGTSVLSFGTAGCNLACRYCQNWEISKSRRDETLSEAAPPTAVAEAARELGCRSVAFTYNDPVIFLEYAADTAQECRRLGVKSVAVTGGYVNDAARPQLFRHMDAANVDLKAFSDNFYARVCGGRLQPVLDTLVYLKRRAGVWLEVTTLLLPGQNDGDDEIGAMTRWAFDQLGPDVPWHFTAFHPDWKMVHLHPTPPATLRRARDIARRNGLRHVYTGNIRDPEGSSTFCARCGAVLIAREDCRVVSWGLADGGRCERCGEACPGVFERQPGDADAWPRPVTLAAAGRGAPP